MSTDGSSSSETLFSGYSGHISLILALGMLATNLGRQILPPLLPSIIEDLTITTSEAGFALTVLWAVFAITQFPAGRASDSLSRKTVVAGGLVLLVISYSLLLLITQYRGFIIAVVFAGAGTGLYIITSRAYLSDLFVYRRSGAIGVNQATGQLGGALAAGLAVLVISFSTWRVAFVPVLLLLFTTLILVNYYSRQTYGVEKFELDITKTGKRVFKQKEIRAFVLVYSLFAFSLQAVIGFMPTYLQTAKLFTSTNANIIYSFMFIVAVFTTPIAGGLGDRFSRTRIAGSSLVLMTGGLILILVSNSFIAVVGSTSVFAIGMRSFPPVAQAYVLDVFPDEKMAGDFGVFRTVYLGVGSLGPSYVGLVANYFNFTLAFYGLILFLLTSIFIIILKIT